MWRKYRAPDNKGMAPAQQQFCCCRCTLVPRIIPIPITDDIPSWCPKSFKGTVWQDYIWEWIGLEKDINCYWFFIFYFWSWIFDKSSRSEPLHAKMNPTSCFFGSRFACAQTAIFFRWTVLQKCRRDINSSSNIPQSILKQSRTLADF